MCNIAVAYTTLLYPCFSDTPLTFLPIFGWKACLDSQIGWLNPVRFIAYAIAHIKSCSYDYMFSIFWSDLHSECICYLVVYPCIISDTLLTLWPIFLGKACLDTRIRWVVKIWIQPSDSHLYQLLHGGIWFVAFGNHICSRTYVIGLVYLHVFHFL